MSDKHAQTSTTIQMMKLFQDNVKKVKFAFFSHLEIDKNICSFYTYHAWSWPVYKLLVPQAAFPFYYLKIHFVKGALLVNFVHYACFNLKYQLSLS